MITQITFAQSAPRTGSLVASGGKLSPTVASTVHTISDNLSPATHRYCGPRWEVDPPICAVVRNSGPYGQPEFLKNQTSLNSYVDYYENIGLRLDTVGDLRCNIWYILMQAVAGLGDEEGSLSISSAKRWLSVEKCRLCDSN